MQRRIRVERRGDRGVTGHEADSELGSGTQHFPVGLVLQGLDVSAQLLGELFEVRAAFVDVFTGDGLLEVVERELRVDRNAHAVGHAHDAVRTLGLTQVAHPRDLQVVVNTLSQSRGFHDVGELNLAPVTALIAASEQLI